MKKGAILKSEIERIHTSEEPRQYQRGWVEFYKLRFHLTRDVLIPRPETELLVDEVLSICHPRPDRGSINQIDSRFRGNDRIVILDIGTGSGCIAISIAKNSPNAKIIATDISKKALEVAQKNARFHKVLNQIIFLESDLLQDFKKSPDIIVANLPYIPTARLMYIDPMVSDWEPKIALDGGQDGFELYRNLFAQIASHFKGVKLNHPEGGKLKYLFGEIDDTHAEIAMFEAKKFFPASTVTIKKDLAKKNRILIVKF